MNFCLHIHMLSSRPSPPQGRTEGVVIMIPEVWDNGVAELPQVGVNARPRNIGLSGNRPASKTEQDYKGEYEYLRLHRSVAQGANLVKFAE